MTRRLLVLGAAVVLAVGGQLLLWTAGTNLVQLLTSPFPSPQQIGLVPLVLLGAALLGASIATVAYSSLGALVVGTFAVIVGLLGMLIPAQSVVASLPTIDRTLENGLILSVATGLWLIGGSVFVAIALAARSARQEPSTATRVVVIAIALTAGLGGVALGALGSERIVNRTLRLLESLDLIGLVFVVLAAVLLAGAALTARWSAAGGVVLGALLLVFGIATILVPTAIGALNAAPDLRIAVAYQAYSGTVAALGAILLGGALGVRARRKRRHPV